LIKNGGDKMKVTDSYKEQLLNDMGLGEKIVVSETAYKMRQMAGLDMEIDHKRNCYKNSQPINITDDEFRLLCLEYQTMKIAETEKHAQKTAYWVKVLGLPVVIMAILSLIISLFS